MPPYLLAVALHERFERRVGGVRIRVLGPLTAGRLGIGDMTGWPQRALSAAGPGERSVGP